MTTKQVKDVLGRPKRQFTEEEYRAGRMFTGGRSSLGNEYWFYKNFPSWGRTTMVTIRDGIVIRLDQDRS